MAKRETVLGDGEKLALARTELARCYGLLSRIHCALELEGKSQEERNASLAEWCGEREREFGDRDDG